MGKRHNGQGVACQPFRAVHRLLGLRFFFLGDALRRPVTCANIGDFRGGRPQRQHSLDMPPVVGGDQLQLPVFAPGLRRKFEQAEDLFQRGGHAAGPVPVVVDEDGLRGLEAQIVFQLDQHRPPAALDRPPDLALVRRSLGAPAELAVVDSLRGKMFVQQLPDGGHFQVVAAEEEGVSLGHRSTFNSVSAWVAWLYWRPVA